MTALRRLLTALGATALLLALPAAVPAVVPPKDCGRMTVKGKRYQVKVDQISCSTGRTYTSRYLARGSKPRGYRCRENRPKRNSVQLSCSSGRKQLFVIRR